MANPEELAKKRHERNAYSRTNRPISGEAEKLGIAGELAFANLIGIDHTPASAAPTRGYQFNLGPNKRIKVSTSRTPGNLFVKEGKVTADVYVLAGVSGDADMENVWFVGWAHSGQVHDAPTITPTHKGGYVQPAHAISRDNLMDMKYLLHALDINPEHLLRFPLSLNGHIEVEKDEPATLAKPKQEPDVYKPLPLKQPKLQ